MSTRHFQIELAGTGIAPTIGQTIRFARTSKIIEPSLIPNGTYLLGAESYYNNDSPSSLRLYDTATGTLMDTLVLPTTPAGNSAANWTRVRSSKLLTLRDSGPYVLELPPGDPTKTVVFNPRLIASQANPYATVEHIPLLIAPNGSASNGSGLTGGDLFRTTALTYVPIMSLTAGSYDEGGTTKFNFIWFKYVAAEWPNIDHFKLEMCVDGFSDHTWGALFKVDPTSATQTLVAGSEFSHDNSPAVPQVILSGKFQLPSDGYYAFRGRSQWTGMAANAFYYQAFLHAVMKVNASTGLIAGNTYLREGNGNKGQAKCLPATLVGPTYFQLCGFHNVGQPHTFMYDSGTADAGLGSEITQSDLTVDAAYSKLVVRSPDISSNLPAGHRFDGDDEGAIALETTILNPFSLAASALGRRTRVIGWEQDHIPQPVSIADAVGPWDNAGSDQAKFIQGFILDADTFNAAKSIAVRSSDTGAVVQTFTVTHNGQQAIAYSFDTPFVAHLVRLEGTGTVPWKNYRIQWIWQPTPELAKTWTSQPTTHGLGGYHHIKKIVFAYIASAQVTLTLTAYDGTSPSSIVLASTGGASQKLEIIPTFNKGLLFTYSGVSTAGWSPLLAQCEIHVGAWNRSGSYEIYRNLGGEMGDQARV
jgi:hypothetical protein